MKHTNTTKKKLNKMVASKKLPYRTITRGERACQLNKK
jgi:hypothetical protein